MKSYAYYSLIRNTTIQFLDLFNDIEVRRFRKDGTVEKIIGKVPVRFGPKSKIWNWLEQQNFDVVLPMISIFFINIEIDSERLAGINSSYYDRNTKSGTASEIKKPTPYNFLYKVTVWTKYVEDLNQILENILPYFQPFVPVTIKVPVSGEFLNLVVELESMTPTGNEEYGVEDRRILTWELNFKVRGWLFKEIDKDASKLVKKVLVHFKGRDATVSYNVDSTFRYSINADADYAVTVTSDTTEGGQHIELNNRSIDWEYSIYEPPETYEGWRKQG